LLLATFQPANRALIKYKVQVGGIFAIKKWKNGVIFNKFLNFWQKKCKNW
jgi:hypothetical protein